MQDNTGRDLQIHQQNQEDVSDPVVFGFEAPRQSRGGSSWNQTSTCNQHLGTPRAADFRFQGFKVSGSDPRREGNSATHRQGAKQISLSKDRGSELVRQYGIE